MELNLFNLIIILGIFAAVIIGIMIILMRLTFKQATAATQETFKALSEIGGIKAFLQTMESGQKILSQSLQDTHKVLSNIDTKYEYKRRLDEGLKDSLSRLENIIAGTKSKGQAGENIVREALRCFPPQMVTNNFRVRGKEVEFALVLFNKKVVPIDSKWTSTDLLSQLAENKDENIGRRLIKKIEQEIRNRIAEVSQYIDPDLTAPLAIAAVPEAAFAVCKNAHLDAYKKGVIIVSYPMLIPYLLTLYTLQLQYLSSIDVENIQHYLITVKRNLEDMEQILETKFQRSSTMLDNAITEYRQKIGSIKGVLSSLEKPANAKQ